ncbi:hypothetical protein ACFL35_10625 [Candidatus Riflebacteria bacterium]
MGRENLVAEILNKIYICGKTELPEFAQKGITHLISIQSPPGTLEQPAWFKGDYLKLIFSDIVKLEKENITNPYRKLAREEDIECALEFGRCFFKKDSGKMLIHCAGGYSRSPAIALAIIADYLGPGEEKRAVAHMKKIRPPAAPNIHVVHITDLILEREERLLNAVYEIRRKK